MGKKRNEERVVRYNTTFRRDLLERTRAYAEKTGLKLATIINQALEAYLSGRRA